MRRITPVSACRSALRPPSHLSLTSTPSAFTLYLPPIASPICKRNKIQQKSQGKRMKKSQFVPATYSIHSFHLLRTIGTGSYSRVKLGIEKTNATPVAIKIISKSLIVGRNQVRHSLAEKQILEKLSSPFIVHLHCSFQDDYYLYLVLEFIGGGELYTLLAKYGGMAKESAVFYTTEVVAALSYLHSLRIVYRDLKPENILLRSDGHLKLADLGFAKSLEICEKTFTLCGTAEYLAPETVTGTGTNYATDWWQLGILIYELLAGVTPFRDSSPMMLYEKIANAEVAYPRHFDPPTVSLLSSLLAKASDQRPTEDQIRSHPFFSGISWKSVSKLHLIPPFRPKVAHPFDLSNFEMYAEEDLSIDEKEETNPDLFSTF